jgi:outer membrane protein assembly factor BamA
MMSAGRRRLLASIALVIVQAAVSRADDAPAGPTPSAAVAAPSAPTATAEVAPSPAGGASVAPSAPTGVATLAPSSPTAAALPENRTATGLFGALERAADWFFVRERGPQHARSWGFVPLVVADSNAGFGGGIKFVETRLFGAKIRFDTSAHYTSKQFFETVTTLGGPKLFDVVSWQFSVLYRSRPRLFFYGIGNEVEEDDKASLWLEETAVEARLGGEPSENLTISGLARFSNINARDGRRNGSVPPVSEAFDTRLITGFGDRGYTNALGPIFVYDILDSRFNPTFGARLEIAGLYHGPEIGDTPFRFGFYWLDVSAYTPVIERHLTLAVHARGECVDAGLARVPFYSLPSLGGADTMRGFYEGRVRDRYSILFQAELRFPIWKVLQGAVFVDAGRVFHRFPRDRSFFSNFLYDGGAGVRFVIHPDIVVRLDFAVSGEQITFALAFGYPF